VRSGAGPSAETVLALDNVPLELPVAGVASRSLSAFVDYVAIAVLSLLWVVLMAALMGSLRSLSGWWIALGILGLFAIDYLYFAGTEIWLEGQTPGKRLLGLRVVTADGGRAGVPALLLRNAVRLADLFVGVPLMAIDPLARRLGDRLGGTLVVHTRPAGQEVLVRRVPRGWSGRDVAVLESFLSGARDLEPGRAHGLAVKLLGAIERDDPGLLAGAARDGDPVEALRRAVTGEA
jgi:uncharacterized RDD family membrane protein YckC